MAKRPTIAELTKQLAAITQLLDAARGAEVRWLEQERKHRIEIGDKERMILGLQSDLKKTQEYNVRLEGKIELLENLVGVILEQHEVIQRQHDISF